MVLFFVANAIVVRLVGIFRFDKFFGKFTVLFDQSGFGQLSSDLHDR